MQLKMKGFDCHDSMLKECKLAWYLDVMRTSRVQVSGFIFGPE